MIQNPDLADAAAPQPPTIGEKIQSYFNLKDRLEEANRTASRIKGDLDLMEQAFLAEMHETGLTRMDGDAGALIRTEEIVPNVNDWDAFYGFIRDNNAFHLLHRRVSATGIRELFDSQTEVPGVTSTTLYKIRPRAN